MLNESTVEQMSKSIKTPTSVSSGMSDLLDFSLFYTFYGGPVGQTTQHTTFLGNSSVTDDELQTGGGAVRPVSGSEQLCYVGTFQIREKVGQHFLFVIGQNPSPWITTV